jgi:AcrR family transcriptional regulator
MATIPARRRQPGAPAVPAIGLRERKKLKTKEAIQRAAMRLIEKQGYEETTIEEIAAAAEISPSTFFNYFPTKEDVVFLDAYDPMLLDLLQQLPPEMPLNEVLRRALDSLSDSFRRDREVIMARTRLILEVPELRGRIWEEIERNQAMLTAALAQRSGISPDDYELRVTVRLLIAAMWEAFVEWSRDPRQDYIKLAERALDYVQSGANLSKRRAPSRRKARTRTRTKP